MIFRLKRSDRIGEDQESIRKRKEGAFSQLMKVMRVWHQVL